jgi:hypothetical protein
MQDQNEIINTKLESLETRLSQVEVDSKEIMQLVGGLTQIVQQIMKANNTVMNLAKKIQEEKKST